MKSQQNKIDLVTKPGDRSIKVEPEPGVEENNAGANKNPPLPPNETEVAPAPPPGWVNHARRSSGYCVAHFYR